MIGCEACRTTLLVAWFFDDPATRSFRAEYDSALAFGLAALTDLAFAGSVFGVAFLCFFDSAGFTFLETFGNFFEEWSIFAGTVIVDEE